MGTHAQTPPDKTGVKVTGWKVSAEGGEQGAVTYHYDEHGRPIRGTPSPTEAARAPGQGGAPRAAEADRSPESGETAVLPRRSTTLLTEDGRALPFQLSGQGGVKTVDETVDADSALRKLTKGSDLLARRYEAGRVDLAQDERFSTSGNVVSLGRWQAGTSALNGQRSEIELTDTLGAEVRPKHLVEVRALERPTSPWAHRVAQPAGWDARLEGAAALGERRVDREELVTMGTRANAFPRNPGSIDQLSMQDINRYQFRRSRSTEPGQPVAKPGSDTIERTR